MLFGNVPLNGLNEWNVHKLGWLKHDSHSHRSREGRKEVSQHKEISQVTAEIE